MNFKVLILDYLYYFYLANKTIIEYKTPISNEEEYYIDSDSYVTKIYTADVSYDDTHNPYFYTLEAAGIIEVLDGVRLNFGIQPQVPEILKARMFFPVNNPSQIIYKNEEGDVVYTINANYVYDNDN